MPIADYQCNICGQITEELRIGPLPPTVICPCGNTANRVITLARIAGSQEAPAWIKLTADVAGNTREANELKKHPTRTNLGKFLKARGLRFDEGNEKHTRTTRQEMKDRNLKIMHETLRDIRRIEI